jgi:hypothetical protein
MDEPCARCGGSHAGECPQAESAPAATAPREEACAFCGERHPRSMKCGEWAQKVGTTIESPWGSSGFATLPDRPPLVLRAPEEKPASSRTTDLILKGCVAVLAVIGALALVILATDRIGRSSSASAAALPDCSGERLTANLLRASTIQAEARPVPVRIDETHSLLLRSSSACTPQILQLYTSFIDYQALCLGAAKTDACPNRDSARVQLAQALAEASQ